MQSVQATPAQAEQVADEAQAEQVADERISKRLSLAQLASDRSRVRISGSFVVVGLTTEITGVGLFVAALFLPGNFGSPFVYIAIIAPGVLLQLLALLPTDARAIRGLVEFASWTSIMPLAVLCVVQAVLTALEVVTFGCASDSECAAWVAVWAGGGAVLGFFACTLSPALRTDPTSGVPTGMCARRRLIKEIKSSKKIEWSALQHKAATALAGPSMAFWLEGTGCYSMPARVALLRLWAALRAVFLALGLLVGALATIMALTRDDGTGDADFAGLLTAASSLLVCATLSTASNRRRIHAWLSRLVVQSENRAAATIACLVGQTASPKVALLGAQKSFTALPFAAISA